MKNALSIFVFTLLVTAFYNHVGQLVPQKEVPPPAKVTMSDSMSSEEMVAAGETIVDGKCMSCHGVQPRFPALDGIGARAGSTRDGYSDVDYLAEALYEPDAFIVETFAAGMTAANKPPLSLNDQEILTVIAYLQSLGGTPSVTMDTELKYQGQSPAAESAPAAAGGEPRDGLTVYNESGCGGCHMNAAPVRTVGPSLFDIGKRLSEAEMYEAIMNPDAVMAEGTPPYPPTMMKATLDGGGFYQKVTATELKNLVDYLLTLKGGG